VTVIGAVSAVIPAVLISNGIQTMSPRDIGFILLIALIGVVIELRKLQRKAADADARNAVQALPAPSVDTKLLL
jgi:hypothetical protein